MATPTIDFLPPNPHDDKNRGNDNGDNKKSYKVLKAIGAIGLAVGGFFAYQAINERATPDVDKIAQDTINEKLAEQSGSNGNIYNGDPVQITMEAPVGVTLDTSSHEEFYKYFSQEQRVEWANSQLDQSSTNPEFVGMTVLEAKWTELASKYNLPDAPKFLEDLVSPSESMTGNQILARLTVIANVISDEPSEDKQLKLLAAYVDPANSTLFNDRATMLENGNDLHRGTNSVRVDAQTGGSIESPVFTTANPGNGYSANGIPSKVMSVGDAQGGVAQDIVRFYNGIPVFYDVYNVNDSKNIPYPERIPAN